MTDTRITAPAAPAGKRRRKLGSFVWAYLVATAATVASIAAMTRFFKFDSFSARFFLDYGQHTVFPYPYTIQNFMYFIFAFALAELWVRWRTAEHEHRLLAVHLLPEDDMTVLEYGDPRLGRIKRKAAGLLEESRGYLPYLIDVSISRLLSSRSIDQVIAVFNASVDILSHRIDLNYQVLRYLIWLIPTIGFIGTVIGISVALDAIDPDRPDLKAITDRLGIAFYTTIVALVESMIIYFFQNMIQLREESALNGAASYCLKNLINRMYVSETVTKPA